MVRLYLIKTIWRMGFMLRLEKLVKTYKTGDQALKAVELEVPEG